MQLFTTSGYSYQHQELRSPKFLEDLVTYQAYVLHMHCYTTTSVLTRYNSVACNFCCWHIFSVKTKWWTSPPSSDICGNCWWSPTIATNIPRLPFSFYSVGNWISTTEASRQYQICMHILFIRAVWIACLRADFVELIHIWFTVQCHTCC